MELAVLGLSSGVIAGADVGLEAVEAEGDNSLIGRDGGGNGALGAAVTREAGLVDLDLLRVGGVGPAVVSDDLSNGAGGSESGEEESDGLHFDDWVAEKAGWKPKMMMVRAVIGRSEGWRMLKA